MGEELQEDEVVVLVGDDAGEVVGFAEEEAARVVFGGDGGEIGAEPEGGADTGTHVAEVLSAAGSGLVRDEAEGDLRGRAVEGGAVRDPAAVDDGDERSGRDFTVVDVGFCAGIDRTFEFFDVGSVDPQVARSETVRRTSRDGGDGTGDFGSGRRVRRECLEVYGMCHLTMVAWLEPTLGSGVGALHKVYDEVGDLGLDRDLSRLSRSVRLLPPLCKPSM